MKGTHTERKGNAPTRLSLTLIDYWNHWQRHSQVCLLFVNEQKPRFFKPFSFKTGAIIRISSGKMDFAIQTKRLKVE